MNIQTRKKPASAGTLILAFQALLLILTHIEEQDHE